MSINSRFALLNSTGGRLAIRNLWKYTVKHYLTLAFSSGLSVKQRRDYLQKAIYPVKGALLFILFNR